MGVFDWLKKDRNGYEEDKIKTTTRNDLYWESALGGSEGLLSKTWVETLFFPNRQEPFEIETPHFGKRTIFAKYKSINEIVTAIALVLDDNNTYITYPQNIKTVSHNVTIRNVIESKDKLFPQARIMSDDRSRENFNFIFFATDYYKNKSKYFNGNNLSINFSTFAYMLCKATDKEIEWKDSMGFIAGKMCVMFPAMFPLGISIPSLMHLLKDKTTSPDSYWFKGKIVEEISVGENKLFKTKMIEDEKNSFDIWTYCLKQNLKGSFQAGDYIMGLLWLQRWIAD